MRTEAMALLSRMWKAISGKRTVWGWIFALISAVLYVSEKWDSLNSFYEKLKKMGPFFRLVSDAAQAPVVQLSIFLLGVAWIGIAAVISARKTGKFGAVNFGDLITFSGDHPNERTELWRDMAKPTSVRFSGVMVSYNKDGTDCMFPTTYQDGETGIIARLRVDSETESIAECKTTVTSLDANSRTLVSGVQLPLLFAPAHNPHSDTKVIRRGQPEYLELLWIPNSGEAVMMPNFPFAFTKYRTLHQLSAYSFNVAFSVDSVITSVIVDAAYSSGVWMLSIRSSSVKSSPVEASQHIQTEELYRLLDRIRQRTKEARSAAEQGILKIPLIDIDNALQWEGFGSIAQRIEELNEQLRARAKCPVEQRTPTPELLMAAQSVLQAIEGMRHEISKARPLS